jgi:hypothetical protein
VPAATALVAALLTQLVYPVLYDRIIVADALAATVLTLRNLVMVALFTWTVVRLARVPRRPRQTLPTT